MRRLLLCAALLMGLSGCEAARVVFNLGPQVGGLIGSDNIGPIAETKECPCPEGSAP